jgi:hypothetical protein
VNDLDYRASLKDFNSFVEALSEKLIEVDDTIPELPLKDIVSFAPLLPTGALVHASMKANRPKATFINEHAKQVFRIHRDVRFSKDQTPYKVRISASPRRA